MKHKINKANAMNRILVPRHVPSVAVALHENDMNSPRMLKYLCLEMM